MLCREVDKHQSFDGHSGALEALGRPATIPEDAPLADVRTEPAAAEAAAPVPAKAPEPETEDSEFPSALALTPVLCLAHVGFFRWWCAVLDQFKNTCCKWTHVVCMHLARPLITLDIIGAHVFHSKR